MREQAVLSSYGVRTNTSLVPGSLLRRRSCPLTLDLLSNRTRSADWFGYSQRLSVAAHTGGSNENAECDAVHPVRSRDRRVLSLSLTRASLRRRTSAARCAKLK